jgi:hypothetical protein
MKAGAGRSFPAGEGRKQLFKIAEPNTEEPQKTEMGHASKNNRAEDRAAARSSAVS